MKQAGGKNRVSAGRAARRSERSLKRAERVDRRAQKGVERAQKRVERAKQRLGKAEAAAGMSASGGPRAGEQPRTRSTGVPAPRTGVQKAGGTSESGTERPRENRESERSAMSEKGLAVFGEEQGKNTGQGPDQNPGRGMDHRRRDTNSQAPAKKL